MDCCVCKQENEQILYCPFCTHQKCLPCNQKSECSHIDDCYFLCGECENTLHKAQVFCSDCGQNLCETCNSKIHKKSKRVKHLRNQIVSPKKLANQTYKQMAIIFGDFFEIFKDNQVQFIIEHMTKQCSQLEIMCINWEKIQLNFSLKEKICDIRKKHPQLILTEETISYKEGHDSSLLAYIIIGLFDQENQLKSNNIRIMDTLYILGGHQSLSVSQTIFTNKDQINSQIHTDVKIYMPTLNDKYMIDIQQVHNIDIIKELVQQTQELVINLSNSNQQKVSQSQSLNMFLQKNNVLGNNDNQPTVKNTSYDQHSNTNTNTNTNYKSYENSMIKNSLSFRSEQIQMNQYTSINVYQTFKLAKQKDNTRHMVLKVLDYMMENAEQGVLMIEKQKFIQEQEMDEGSLKQLVEMQYIHILQRKFNTSENQLFQQEYVALYLEQISVHALVWVLKSIKVDKMTPSEKFVISRIKECFSLKISQKVWEKRILKAIQRQKYLVNQNNHEMYSSENNCAYFPKITYKQVQDPLIGSDTYVFYPNNDKWESEDVADKQTINANEWKHFIEFLNQFFDNQQDNSTENTSKTNQNMDTYNYQFINNTTNTNNTNNNNDNNNTNNNDTSLNNNNNKKEKNLLGQKIKAIPGGRYGCAQFIKIRGPQILRDLSLGKLNLFVQEAINQGIIKYYRTLLIKNDSTHDFKNNCKILIFQDNTLLNQSEDYQKDQVIEKLKQILIEILKENQMGISLAQIPQFMKQKLKNDFNLQELGFPKLKNFLKLFEDDISIENSKYNNQYAILKNKNQECFQQQNNKQILSEQTQNYMNKVSLNQKLINNQQQSQQQQQQKSMTYNQMYSLQELQIRIVKMIYYILNQSSQEINTLLEMVQQELQFKIDFQVFYCTNFQQFIHFYMEYCIELDQQDSKVYVKLKGNITENNNYTNNYQNNNNQLSKDNHSHQYNFKKLNKSTNSPTKVQLRKQMNFNAQPVNPFTNENANNYILKRKIIDNKDQNDIENLTENDNLETQQFINEHSVWGNNQIDDELKQSIYHKQSSSDNHQFDILKRSNLQAKLQNAKDLFSKDMYQIEQNHKKSVSQAQINNKSNNNIFLKQFQGINFFQQQENEIDGHNRQISEIEICHDEQYHYTNCNQDLFKSEHQQNNELNENFIKNNIMAEDCIEEISEIRREDKASNKLSSDIDISIFMNAPVENSLSGLHQKFKSDDQSSLKHSNQQQHNRIYSIINNK